MSALQDTYLQNAFLHTVRHDPHLFYSAFASSPAITKGIMKRIPPASKTLFSNILLHVKHIQQSGIERKVINDREATVLAIFIETVVKKSSSIFAEFFQASIHCPRHLQYSSATGKVAVIAQDSLAQLFITGGYKSVQSAAILHVREPSRSFQRAVCTVPLPGKSTVSKQELENLILMQHTRGIVHIESYCELLGGGYIVVLDGYSATLSSLFVFSRCLSFENKMRLAKDLVLGVIELHRRGCAHTDLSSNNALFRYDENGDIEGAISDLGLSFIRQNKQPRTSLLNYGYYCAIEHTAPEHFGRENFADDEDDFAKDVFALGCLLYRLLFSPQQALPWSQYILDSYNNDFTKNGAHKDTAELLSNQQNVQLLIQQHVELPPL